MATKKSPLTSIFSAVKQMAKGIERMAHSVTLLTAENHDLRKANEALSRRRRAKKTRVRKGGTITVGDAQDILTQNKVEEQIARETRQNPDQVQGRTTTLRRCNNCNKSGHNTRTCQVDAEISNVDSSE